MNTPTTLDEHIRYVCACPRVFGRTPAELESYLLGLIDARDFDGNGDTNVTTYRREVQALHPDIGAFAMAFSDPIVSRETYLTRKDAERLALYPEDGEYFAAFERVAREMLKIAFSKEPE